MGRLLRDRAGNTLALMAAGLVPLLALVGGGIDMGRSYLAQTRLQQACDAGVLAARKKLGSQVVLTGTPPADVKTIGDQFFSQNFASGSYGTKNRSFLMTLEPDYAISGAAHVDVSTSVMYLFGYTTVGVDANCSAKLNFSNTDIMFAIDTTGSMSTVDSGETMSRLASVRKVIKDFHTQVEGSKAPGVRIRYGFVPYAENVNVGGLLKSDWLVDRWSYHGREPFDTGVPKQNSTYNWEFLALSGTSSALPSYESSTCPSSSNTWTETAHGFDANGDEYWEYLDDGLSIGCKKLDSGLFQVDSWQNNKFAYRWTWKKTITNSQMVWYYHPMSIDVTSIKNADGNLPPSPGTIQTQMGGQTADAPTQMTANYRGCVEERDTYEITDYNNVDFNRALDLDVDRVPTAGNPSTQWRPIFGEISFMPRWGGNSSGFQDNVKEFDNYWQAWTSCPTAAQRLQEMDSTQISAYLNSLYSYGGTYHDIGMIWAARLISPTGLFATDNANQPGKSTSRHIIFLTDGETSADDMTYDSYGIEGLDGRRWTASSPLTLSQTVEKRWTVACQEAKKRNITVWLIGFGTSLNPEMTACVGPGHYFEARNSATLSDVFSKIASQMGDLRISK